MIDKLGWYLEPDEFKIKLQNLTNRQNIYDWKAIRRLTHPAQYFPSIRPEGPCLKILTCPSKALYNHNLYEITPNDREQFLEVTCRQLLLVGIEVSKEILRKKRLSVLHVNKLVQLPLTINCCSRMLQTAEKYGKFKHGISLYPNEGWCVFNNLKYRKLKFYDKTVEALKQPFARELAEALQKNHKTLLQVEFQMQGAREIEREYALQGIKLENTLENAFNPEVAYKILYARTKEALKHLYVVDLPEYKLIENTEIICQKNNIHGIQAKSAVLGFLWVCQHLGINGLLNILTRWSDSKVANKYYKKIRKLFSLVFEQREKDLFKRTILSSIQSIREKSYPLSLCNTTKAWCNDIKDSSLILPHKKTGEAAS